MPTSQLDLADVETEHAPGSVPYAVLLPAGADAAGSLPLCLLLHGGGDSRDFLVGLRPLFDLLWEEGVLPPMAFACASTGELSWYLDHPDGSERWETFVGEAFLSHLRSRYPLRRDRAGTVVCGASMGGYGSLKLAFRHPERFLAVAALEPAVEPALRAGDAPPRNRFHYAPGGGPAELHPATRDAAVWEANNPANLARENAEAIRDSGLAIYLEVGDHDCLNLHDGTEFLHRVLWDLDLSHEYHLVRGADHVGPSVAGRLREALLFLAAVLAAGERGDEPYEPTPDERAWLAWAAGGYEGEAPAPLDVSSEGAVHLLRLQFGPALDAAARVDPTTRRRFGVLGKTR